MNLLLRKQNLLQAAIVLMFLVLVIAIWFWFEQRTDAIDSAIRQISYSPSLTFNNILL